MGHTPTRFSLLFALLLLFGGLSTLCGIVFPLPFTSPLFLEDVSRTYITQVVYLVIGVLGMGTFFTSLKEKRWSITFWLSLASSVFLGLFIEHLFRLHIFSPTFFISGHFPALQILLLGSLTLPLYSFERRWFFPWCLFFLITGLAYLFEGGHTLGDVGLSFTLGILLGGGLTILENRRDLFTLSVQLFHHELELRRQIVHTLLGVVLVLLLSFHVLTAWMLGVICVVGGILSYMTRRRPLPLLSRVLGFLERKKHMEKFPGRGAFYFILGSFLVTLFLPLPIALASILILALGDSFTNIIGRYFGKIHLPYNPKKTIEGPLFGFVLAGIGGSFFVSPLASFVASFVAMAIETLPLRIGSFEIDDNLTIPVVAGVVMFLLV